MDNTDKFTSWTYIKYLKNINITKLFPTNLKNILFIKMKKNVFGFQNSFSNLAKVYIFKQNPLKQNKNGI